MNTATLFAGLVFLVIAGWLWFYIMRPILEDFGVISVNDSDDAAPVIMSRSENHSTVLPVSSKDGQGDGRTDSLVYERAELLTLYKVLRKYGVPREEMRPVLKAMRIPLSNDVWASAAPEETQAASSAYVTPIVGRPTSAKFETDADFPYQAPAH